MLRRGLEKLPVLMAVMITCVALMSISVCAADETQSANTKKTGTAIETSDETDAPADPPAIKSGWNDKHNKYIGTNGKAYVGKKKIGNKIYYFNKKGKLVTGWKKIDGRYYYFNPRSGGAAAKGVKKINGDLYFFRETSGAARTKGFFKDEEGNEYYSTSKKGKLATGWKAIRKKDKLRGYYFSVKNGRMAKNTTVGHLKIPKSGRLPEAYALGIKTLDRIGWNLEAAYQYSYKIHYYDRWYREYGKNQSEKYSIRGFEEQRGNCYVMGATFYVMAKLLGYDIRQVYGKVSLPHSWTEIKHGDNIYVYDPNFRNETGRSGWKIYYGKKGTWRYTKYGNLNDFVKKGKFR